MLTTIYRKGKVTFTKNVKNNIKYSFSFNVTPYPNCCSSYILEDFIKMGPITTKDRLELIEEVDKFLKKQENVNNYISLDIDGGIGTSIYLENSKLFKPLEAFININTSNTIIIFSAQI